MTEQPTPVEVTEAAKPGVFKVLTKVSDLQAYFGTLDIDVRNIWAMGNNSFTEEQERRVISRIHEMVDHLNNLARFVQGAE